MDNYVTVPKFEQPSLFVVVLRLATKFCPHVDGEMLKDDFEDLQLMEDDDVVTRVDGHQRRLDHIWGDVMDMKTAMGVVRFPPISTLFTALLGLPHSNADSERTFSMLRKIHADARSNLHADTITAYLQCKLNFDSCSHQLEATPAMLQDAKHACVKNNRVSSDK